MIFDGYAVRALVEELKEKIIPGRISQIIQIDRHTLLFSIATKAKKYRFLVSVHPRFFRAHLTSQPYPSETEITPFTTRLRKVCHNAMIISVRQFDSDRIIHLTLSQRKSFLHVDFKLIIELTGRMSNIIVIRPKENTILTSWKQIDIGMCRYRQILPGYEYVPPPPPAGLNPMETDFGEFEDRMRRLDNELLSKALTRSLQDVGQTLANECIYHVGLQPDAFISRLSTEKLQSLWEAATFLSTLAKKGSYAPTVYIGENGIPAHFSPFRLKQFSADTALYFDSMSQALEFYYSAIIEKKETEKTKQGLLTAVVKERDYWKRTKEHLERDIARAEGHTDYRRRGELIVANMSLLRKGMDRVKVVDYFHTDQPQISIELDPNLSPEENAQTYFRKAKKGKNAVFIAKKRLQKTNARLNSLTKLVEELENVKEREGLVPYMKRVKEAGIVVRKKRTSKRLITAGTPFRRFVTSSGWTVLVGRNNKENDRLTFSVAAPDDIWFHARGVGGSHVVLRREGRKGNVDKKTLEEAANLAAYFSKARGSKMVPVSYTEKRFVRRPKGSPSGTVLVEREKTDLVEPKLLQTESREKT